MIDWQAVVTHKPPKQEALLVTSEHFPGWKDIASLILGEWRQDRGTPGSRTRHEPTHWARITEVESRGTN